MEFVQKICSIVRSTRSDYNLPNKTKTDLYVRVFNDSKLAQEIDALNDVIMSSAYASKVTVTETDSKIPEGCAIGKDACYNNFDACIFMTMLSLFFLVTVSDKCSAHLFLKGIIDPIKELEKLQKKKDTMKSQLEKLKKSMEIPDYATKVPVDVQTSNKEKLSQMDTEINRLTEAMSFLKAM